MLLYIQHKIFVEDGKEPKSMKKGKKKNRNQDSTPTIVLVTAILGLIKTVIELIEKLLE